MSKERDQIRRRLLVLFLVTIGALGLSIFSILQYGFVLQHIIAVTEEQLVQKEYTKKDQSILMDGQYHHLRHMTKMAVGKNSISFGVICGAFFLFWRQSEQICREKAENKRFRMVVNQSSVVVYEYDVKRELFYFTSNFENVFGSVPPQKIMLKEFVYPEDMKFIKMIQKQLQKNGIMSQVELRLKKRDGNYIWCRITGEPIWNQGGELRQIIGKIENIEEEREKISGLLRLSKQDMLTHLFNKVSARREIEKYLLGEGKNEQHAYFFIDIDDFKQINDREGHDSGDKSLVYLSEQLRNIFRESDILGRFGGDEFIVLMKNIRSDTDAKRKAETLVERIAAQPEGLLSVSIGISCYPKDGRDLEQLLYCADIALYHAKKQGKNQYQFYQPL